MDNFIKFATLDSKAHSFLDQYQAPNNELSMYKSIPIKYLEQVRAWLTPAGKFRIVFRGPRYDGSRGYTRKSDAWGFAVY